MLGSDLTTHNLGLVGPLRVLAVLEERFVTSESHFLAAVLGSDLTTHNLGLVVPLRVLAVLEERFVTS